MRTRSEGSEDSPPALPVREGAECLESSKLSSSKVIAPSLTGRAGGESAESAESAESIIISKTFLNSG